MPEHAGYLTRDDALPVQTNLHLPESAGPHPTVALCHGFKGFKDWGWFPWVAEQLAAAGFACLRINFSHNGIGDQPMDFTRLELFEHNSFGQCLKDLGLVRDWIEGKVDDEFVTGLPVPEGWSDGKGISLIGHSMGGGVVTLSAGLRPEGVARVIGWNPVAFTDRFDDAAHAQLKELGYIEVPNKRTNQIMRVGKAYFDDIAEHLEERDITKVASTLQCPYLLVQGSEDEAVPPQESSLVAAAAPHSKIHVIPGAGHTFNSGHPFEEASPELRNAVEATVEFLRE